MALPQFKITPDGGNITIDVKLAGTDEGFPILRGGCRVFLWKDNQRTEIISPNGNLLPWHATLPNAAITYDNQIVDCLAEIIDPAPSSGHQYKITLGVSQTNSAKEVSDQKAIGADKVRPRLALQMKIQP